MSAGERFLRKLFDEMEQRYRIEREERRAELAEKYRCQVFFVHELLECPHKREMKMRFPEIDVASMYNPRFIVGWLIEEGIKKVLGVREEQHYWDKLVQVDGHNYVIAGGIDSRDPETGKPVEIKYLSSLFRTPHEHHLTQLGIYLWGIGEPEGELWMFSPEGTIFLPVEAAKTQEVEDLIRNAVNRQKIPLWDWECNFCSFERFCPNSISKRRGGKKDEEK